MGRPDGKFKTPVGAEKKCYEKFMQWAKSNRYVVDEYVDIRDDLVWLAWKKAWVVSRSVTVQDRDRLHRAELKILTAAEKRDLWIRCSTGKEYGELIEAEMLKRKKMTW